MGYVATSMPIMINRASFFALAALTALACAPDTKEQSTAGTGAEDARGPSGSDADRSAFSGGGDDQIEDGIDNFLSPIKTGNGRACATCHVPSKNFTISPAEANARFKKNPNDPLFRSIDADDFAKDFTTVRTKGLFRVTLPLPANVSLVGSSAREVKLWRAVPSIFNVKLTAPYTHDGRAVDLAEQAKGAALEHSRPTTVPSDSFFQAIAAAQQLAFSSSAVRNISDLIDDGQAPPPVGQDYGSPLNALEQQGFAAFQEHCIVCHGGNGRNEIITDIFPSGFFTAFVSERNRANLPVLQFDVTDPATNQITRVASPDPGRMLISGDIAEANAFDITALRGIAKTAPYFHDNSSPDLRSVIDHYNFIFTAGGIPAVPEDQIDELIAYLNRL
jgi:cytochrome c peroxidase